MQRFDSARQKLLSDCLPNAIVFTDDTLAELLDWEFGLSWLLREWSVAHLVDFRDRRALAMLAAGTLPRLCVSASEGEIENDEAHVRDEEQRNTTSGHLVTVMTSLLPQSRELADQVRLVADTLKPKRLVVVTLVDGKMEAMDEMDVEVEMRRWPGAVVRLSNGGFVLPASVASRAFPITEADLGMLTVAKKARLVAAKKAAEEDGLGASTLTRKRSGYEDDEEGEVVEEEEVDDDVIFAPIRELADVHDLESAFGALSSRLSDPPALVMCAHLLDALGEDLDVEPVVFSLGHTSRLIGKKVLRLRRAAGGQRAGRASLVLVDRTVDMVGPCSHEHPSFLDRIVARVGSLPQDLSGSGSTRESRMLFESVLLNPREACLRAVSRLLMRVVRDELGVNPSALSPPTKRRHAGSKKEAEALEQIHACFAELEGKATPLVLQQHAMLVSLARLVLLVDGEGMEDEEKLRSVERAMRVLAESQGKEANLLGFVTDTLSAALQDAFDAEDQSEERLVRGLTDGVALGLYCFSLRGADGFERGELEALQEALQDTIDGVQEEASELVRQLRHMAHKEGVSEGAYVLQRLEAVGRQRGSELVHLLEAMVSGDGIVPELHYHNPAGVDLDGVSTLKAFSGVVDGVSSVMDWGGSLFQKHVGKRLGLAEQRPVAPCDEATVIVFVVGGITASEVAALSQTAITKVGTTFLFGGSQLAAASRCVEQLLVPQQW